MLSAIGFIPVTLAFDDDRFSFWQLYVPALIGLGVTFLLVAITEYYTGLALASGEEDRRGLDRPATRRTSSRASPYGMQATAFPVLVIAAGVVGAYYAADESIYGIGVAVMAQLSMTGLIVALDAYGPVTDNAGGIAEMADMPESVRQVTDPLDAVGNTTKAVTKGYAIGSAGLAALILFDEYVRGLADEGLDVTLRARGPMGDRRPLRGRDDAVPVRLACDDGRRPRRRRGRRGGAAPVPRGPGHHGGHVTTRLRDVDLDRHRLRDQEHARAGADPDRDPDRRRDHQAGDARRPADRHDRDGPLPRDRDDLGRRRLGQREEARSRTAPTAARARRPTLRA